MTVSDTLANTTRAAHDVGLAAWLGGSMFGKFAHNPSLEKISSHAERGSVSNAAWNGYNLINTAGLGAAALGWTAARFTETRSANLTSTEEALSKAKDGLMAAAVVTGVASGVQGGRLARQARDGAVPIETGTKPAPETPPAAARIQRSLGVLGTLNIVSGVALVAVNAVLAQINHSHPAKKRALTRSSSSNGSSPLWIGSAVTTAVAAVDQARRSRGWTETTIAKSKDKTKGVSLAKGPVALIGLALLAYGVTAFILGGHSFRTEAIDGTVNGESWLGLEVNAWSSLLFIASGALLLFGAPMHVAAKSLSLIVGLVLGAASVIALYDEQDVFGIFAANGLTKLVWGAAGGLLILLSLLPRVGGKKRQDDDTVEPPPTTRRAEREPLLRERPSRIDSEPVSHGARSAESTRRQREHGEFE